MREIGYNKFRGIPIAIMRFGSQIYGTDTPESDQDFKVLYIPDADDILAQTVRDSQSVTTKPKGQLKNTAEDVDIEVFSVQEFLKLLMEGQTMALDMIFNTEEHLLFGTREWTRIVQNRDRFLHSGVSAFAGYCKTQCSKYGIKGSRIAALRSILALLAQFTDPHMRLSAIWDRIRAEVVDTQNPDEERFVGFVDIKGPKDGMEPHLEVCTKSFPQHTAIKYVVDSLQKTLDGYGDRALKAAANLGVDWKAMMHAVRVCGEARELLTAGHITFPRADSEFLRKIRLGGPSNGGFDAKEVSVIIEHGLEELKSLEKTSTLQKEPDRVLADSIFKEYYRAEVMGDLDEERWDPIAHLLTQHGYKPSPN